jgi:hypothetical protein
VPEPRDLDALMGFLSVALRRPDPIADDEALARESVVHVTGNDRLTPAEQVDIYRRQFWLRHVDSLAEDYPGLAALLGEDDFDAFLRAYLTARPSAAFSLRDLGAEIVVFAEGYPDFPPPLRACAIEMVRYENAFVDLFDGAEPPPLDPRKLAALPEDAWEHARIVLHPLLVRMKLEHPVHRFRLAVKEAGGPTAAASLPPPERAPACIGLFRSDLSVHFQEIDPLAYELLDALARGVPLVRACEEVAAKPEAAGVDLDARVGAWFQQWTATRWIVDVQP